MDLDKGAALLIAAVFFCYGGCEAAFGNVIISYASRGPLLASDADAAALNSAFWGALALGRLLAVWASARIPLGLIVGIDALGCLLSLGVILAWPGNQDALWAGSAGTGFFMASFFPCLMALGARRLSPDGRIPASATSFFFVGASLGNVSIPWLTGQAFDRLSPNWGMGHIFFWLFVMALFLLWLWRRLGKSLPAAAA